MYLHVYMLRSYVCVYIFTVRLWGTRKPRQRNGTEELWMERSRSAVWFVLQLDTIIWQLLADMGCPCTVGTQSKSTACKHMWALAIQSAAAETVGVRIGFLDSKLGVGS